MIANNIEKICQKFASATAPLLCIRSQDDYEQALELVESLLEKAQDDQTDPLNAIIEMIARSIERYESNDNEMQQFEHRINQEDDGLSILRLLMDQHQLGVADLPEIGTKSLVSRILSAERNLTKKHIEALSARFQVSPALFFNSKLA